MPPGTANHQGATPLRGPAIAGAVRRLERNGRVCSWSHPDPLTHKHGSVNLRGSATESNRCGFLALLRSECFPRLLERRCLHLLLLFPQPVKVNRKLRLQMILSSGAGHSARVLPMRSPYRPPVRHIKRLRHRPQRPCPQVPRGHQFRSAASRRINSSRSATRSSGARKAPSSISRLPSVSTR